ncbi:retinol dehydrogenase 13-like isoform X1 [Phycodurus eques]|uniref:retinol dehydrogenase 13-like isoform X1 n=1 Tax=Phycodurus eques TaxID=693459 RepID=UPI002ACD6701|nr:retinol dehydrogenase 13-like isoform X1 [Phycodurus eques]XP_061562007.1 retinol dehydrogenase 13-like isoform X1 [Phycodurus eques]XP_061562008.1 retinol dehydrogenase 13-like isoform X1 [Phycodurus eques]
MSKYVLPVSFLGTVVGCAVLLKNHVTGGRCPSKAKLNGKTVIITGANTGIGKETARELALRGGRIIMGCRDMEKCEAAAKEIRGSTLNPHVYACHLDLASMKSIREFAERIKKKEQRVDVLINNAGVMKCPAWKTEDGFDMQFGVNHLGHFLLTNLLLDRLKESAPSRVINLASLAHLVGKMDFEDLNWDRKKFNTKQAYCQSKLANVLFTRKLAKRLQGTGVTVNAVHPGVVSTELGRHTGLHQSQLSTTVLSPFFSLLVKNPELGAQPSIYLAVAEELDGVTGRYYDVLTEKEPAPQAMDEEAARRLWEISSRLVGLEEDKGQSSKSSQDKLPAQSRQTHGQNPGPVVGAVGL